VKIALFGASNQVGACLVPALLAGGHQVTAMSRRPRPPWIAESPDLDWRVHDLSGSEPGSLPGNRAMIYLAPLEYVDRAIQCCPGITRVVAFSSTSRLTKADSSSAAERRVAQGLAEGEDRVRSFCDRANISWTLLRPTIIYGAGLDRSLTRVANIMQRWRLFFLPARGVGLRQPVHAADLAAAAVSALQAPDCEGQCYELPGAETLSYLKMLGRIADSVRGQPRIIRVPGGLVRWAIPALNLLPGFRDLSPALFDRIDQDLVFDLDRAAADLGYQPRAFQPDPECWLRLDQRSGSLKQVQ
jgi:nucleoside-diphosphate-sugar epimerase